MYLQVAQILAWADAFYARSGDWPTPQSGQLRRGTTWYAIDRALREGRTDLERPVSLGRLLYNERDARVAVPLTVEEILAWADDFHAKQGKWPSCNSRQAIDGVDENWRNVNRCLHLGRRSLPGRSSLARLLARHRNAPYRLELSRLTIKQILLWADDFYRRNGCWPQALSGAIPASPDLTWKAVNTALFSGRRGLPGGSSVARLLAAKRGVRNRRALSALSVKQILMWADDHRAHNGSWPTQMSGPVRLAPGETWRRIDTALRAGIRGLAPESSLSRLLSTHRGKRNHRQLPRLSEKRIIIWAVAYRKRHQSWPIPKKAGAIDGAPGETWSAVETALYMGRRGLRGGSSLCKLLRKHRLRD